MASEGVNTSQDTPLGLHLHSAHDVAGLDNLEHQAATVAAITGGEAQDFHQTSVNEQVQQAPEGHDNDSTNTTVPLDNGTPTANTILVPCQCT
jgi:hypothetical protein